jgi:cyclic-di-AMP phosphodiesterase PgpH
MPFGLQKSKRLERVASLELPPGQWERAWIELRRRDVLGRVGLALAAAVAVCAVIRGWNPPFPYRPGYTPPRDIVAAVKFSKKDQAATQAEQQKAANLARYVYARDSEPLVQLRAMLRNTLAKVAGAPTLDKLTKLYPQLWQEFQLPPVEGAKPSSEEQRREQYLVFHAAFTPQEKLDRAEKAIADAFEPFEQRGVLDKVSEKGNQKEISVYPIGRPASRQVVQVNDVLLGDGTAVRDALRQPPALSAVADRLFVWLAPRLKQMKPTLTFDDRRTKEAIDSDIQRVEPVLVEFSVGEPLAKAGQPLEAEQLDLLGLEYAEAMHQRTLLQQFTRALVVTAMIFVGFLLCGVHMRYRQRGPLASLARLITLLLLAVGAIGLARWASFGLRGELAPVLLFGMTMAIVYRREIALLLSGMTALFVALAVGHGLAEFIVLLGTSTAAVLSLGRIRHRSKLIYVGLFAGAATVLLRLGMGVIYNQPLNLPLLRDAVVGGFWAVAAAGFVAAGLPFIEHFFGVLTDLSLLELGDVAHPLLQELVRRAPSTYNHSITVGSIAEAAAESIHARGLLVRIGAYFHDIGKMLKPDYFAENQGPDDNRHEALAPAISTLVIIAHLKDGADLARQHRLPQPIIDLVAQHHGTTRVEFFYDRATERQQADPNAAEVDENTYRYPGPKPQTKEAAVLMLADAVESASRTLVEPTPARIESLVRELAEYRLHDGQFDESGLTLRELRTIEKSMVMSLTSIYHGRIKYPDQRTA